jgi:hypothetical protein
MSRSKPGRSLFEDHWNLTFWLLFLIAAVMFIAQVLISTLMPEIFAGLLIILLGVYVMGADFRSRKTSRVQDETSRKMDDMLQWANKSYDYTRGFKEKHESLIFNASLRQAESEDKARNEREVLAKKLLNLENILNRFLKDIRDKKAIEDHYRLVKPVLEKEAPARIEKPQAVGIEVKPTEPRREPGEFALPKPPQEKPEPLSLPEIKPKEEKKPAKLPNKLGDLNLRQSSSIDTIRKKGKITNKEYAEMFKLTNKTAYRDLNKMVSSGLLKRGGKGRNTFYTLAF